MQDDVRALRDYVAQHLGDELIEWPGGRPGEVEVALVDAVMSIRARYGQPKRTVNGRVHPPTGVHRAVAGYRGLRGGGKLDDLRELTRIDPADLTEAVGEQKTAGTLKAEAILQAAQGLVAAGARSSRQIDPADKKQKSAYTSVTGLGWVTWAYLGMLLGHEDVKSDRWVIQAVEHAVGRPVNGVETREIVRATAHDMGHGVTRLEHALWAFERKRRY